MIRRTATKNLALDILERSGIEAIWRLQTAAAEVYQLGSPSAAAAILEIAEAAEEMLLRGQGTHGPSRHQLAKRAAQNDRAKGVSARPSSQRSK